MKSFEASARHLSFTEAARELNMTQAGISQHVRLLELHLRQPLFHRMAHGLQLTDAGEAYQHVIKQSFDLISSGTRDIFGEGHEAIVTVRANVAFAAHWLASRIGRFHESFPLISVRLLAAVHGVDTVWDGVDLEIRYGTCSQSGLTSVPLMPDRLFPVCDRATAERLHSPCDLLQERLIHVIGNSHGWSEWLEAAGVTPPRRGLSTQTDTSAVALALAASGAGVALGHASLLGDFGAGRRLVQPFDLGIETNGVFHLVSVSGRAIRREPALFAKWLVEEAESDRAIGCRSLA